MESLGSKTQFSCRVLADSVNPDGNRLTTFCVTYPRFIHSELLTHRMFSRNSASSRAIPVRKMIENISEHPVVPIHWGRNQSGMQARQQLSEEDSTKAAVIWSRACGLMLHAVAELNELGLHKQIANRLIEPWMWITVIVSATNVEHFFKLRCHKDAEPHFQKIAAMMRDAYYESAPEPKQLDQWHTPLVSEAERAELSNDQLLRVSVARCARVSYLTHDGERDLEKDLELFERLRSSGHWSPFEHVAKVVKGNVRCGNFVGWRQLRKLFREEFTDEYREPDPVDTATWR